MYSSLNSTYHDSAYYHASLITIIEIHFLETMLTGQCEETVSATMSWREGPAKPALTRKERFPSQRIQPVRGMILRLPAFEETLPCTSVFLKRYEQDNEFGDPWRHPVCVVEVSGDMVTFLQLTSKDVKGNTYAAEWAKRYVPVEDEIHSDPKMPVLKLEAGSERLQKPSLINVENVYEIEWRNLRAFHQHGRNPVLSQEASEILAEYRKNYKRPAGHGLPSRCSPSSSTRSLPQAGSFSGLRPLSWSSSSSLAKSWRGSECLHRRSNSGGSGATQEADHVSKRRSKSEPFVPSYPAGRKMLFGDSKGRYVPPSRRER